ncbi:PH domain-containing protein [Altererythrobacter sp.]|nr:PH domain-containing protein [Altererythrobacter sp.]
MSADASVMAPEAASAVGEEKHTDPLTVIMHVLIMLPQLLIPFLFVSYGMLDDGVGWKLLAAPAFLAVFLGASIIVAYLRWKRFTYRVGATDIKVESGLLSRAARSVPYERIQDVSLEQKFIPRLLGLVEVKFETGAGGKDELKLAYLSEELGASLREVVRERRESEDDRSGEAGDEALVAERATDAELLFEMPPRRLFTFGLFEFSLAVLAVIGGLAQQFDFILPFDIWEWRMWASLFAGPTDQIAALGPAAQVLGVIAAVLFLLMLGVVTGLARTFLRDWNFRLEKTARGFRRRRGLLTRTDVVMPVHRVQALTIGTGLVRKRFGWSGLKFVSLAQDAGSSSHVVAPFAQDEEIRPIIRAARFTPAPDDLDWHRASTAHRNVGMILEGAILTLIGIAAFALIHSGLGDRLDYGQWLALVPFAFGAFLVARQFYLWFYARNAVDATQIYRRSGWLAPSTAIANRVKLQSAEVSQGPIARRLGYATLHLGLAGGKFAVEGIPVERARKLRRAALTSIAGTDFSRLNN